MTNANLTEVIMIVDRSGSMSAIKDDAQGGFNTFVEDQKKSGMNVRLTLLQFDTEHEFVFENLPISDVGTYSLEPRGCTALLDAIGQTMNRVGQRLAATAEEDRPGKILVVIITDGQENASHEFTKQQVFDMITHQRDRYNWEFLFLAANQDAISEGASYGISNSVNYNSTSTGVKCAYSSLSHVVRNFSGTGKICDLPNNVEDKPDVEVINN